MIIRCCRVKTKYHPKMNFDQKEILSEQSPIHKPNWINLENCWRDFVLTGRFHYNILHRPLLTTYTCYCNNHKLISGGFILFFVSFLFCRLNMKKRDYRSISRTRMPSTDGAIFNDLEWPLSKISMSMSRFRCWISQKSETVQDRHMVAIERE